MSKAIKFTLESQLNLVPLLGRGVRGICSLLIKDENILYQLELSLVEVVNNVILHAYNKQEGREIEVTILLAEDHIRFQVVDSGKQFVPKKVNKTGMPLNVNDLPESGMGLFIIHQLVDEISYEQREGKNVTTLFKYIPKKSYY